MKYHPIRSFQSLIRLTGSFPKEKKKKEKKRAANLHRFHFPRNAILARAKRISTGRDSVFRNFIRIRRGITNKRERINLIEKRRISRLLSSLNYSTMAARSHVCIKAAS